MGDDSTGSALTVMDTLKDEAGSECTTTAKSARACVGFSSRSRASGPQSVGVRESWLSCLTPPHHCVMMVFLTVELEDECPPPPTVLLKHS